MLKVLKGEDSSVSACVVEMVWTQVSGLSSASELLSHVSSNRPAWFPP